MVFARPNPVTPPTWRCLLPLVLVLTAPTLVYAQAWQRVIESNGAAGSAIGGGQADTLYAGMASGPVFRSTDNGLTWTGVTNGLVDNASRILVAKAFVVTPTGRILRGGDNASWNNRVGSPLFFPTIRVPRGRRYPSPSVSFHAIHQASESVIWSCTREPSTSRICCRKASGRARTTGSPGMWPGRNCPPPHSCPTRRSITPWPAPATRS
jgi:hypothetical protein